MGRRLAPPGQKTAQAVRSPPGVTTPDLHRYPFWDQFLADPDVKRIGICCSGGGIRSASYGLGALQVLRKTEVLTSAEHLSAVSGGCYTGIAHTVNVGLTLSPENPPPAGVRSEDAEEGFYGELRPWAPGSPEEEHLRDHTTYLAPGMGGKIWMGINLLYGMLRHLLPFAAMVSFAAVLTGFSFHRWVGPSLLRAEGLPGHAPVTYWNQLWIVIGLVGSAALLLVARQKVQKSSAPRETIVALCQSWSLLLLRTAALVTIILIGLPALLLFLHSRPLDLDIADLAVGGVVEAVVLGVLGTLARLARSGKLRRLIPIVAAVSGFLVLLVPYVGMTYWATQQGLQWHPRTIPSGDAVSYLPFWFGVGSFAYLLVSYLWLDEVTANMHLFYRERLATAFVGLRKARGRGFEYAQPKWDIPVWFSKLHQGGSSAKLPNLVVCASVNVSEDVPPGRLAGTFTFERDYSGGPVTGYVQTAWYESKSPVTLPSMMAISGAALAPSMGKMTRPGLRLLMALFNVRLGVWLPNPRARTAGPDDGFVSQPLALSPQQVHELRNVHAGLVMPPEKGERPWHRPGLLYVLREAFGLNSVDSRYVYVSDGGHWDNLGLVELLRRGCGQILCFDAAGDDLSHFHTLSEAIALARSDLGVWIDVDLSPLKSRDDGFSDSDHVTGTILYPDGTSGVLVFAKAAMSRSAPQDVKAFRERDSRFPTHSTGDQLFDDRQFESYRALGMFAAANAVEALNEWRTEEGLGTIPREQP